MSSILFIRRALVTALVMASLGAARQASAQAPPPAEQQCFTSFMSCEYWAAAQSGLFAMWAAGLDCELALANCVRLAVAGY